MVPVIAVNFNNSECSIGMINSLLPQAELLDEIVIVDNASGEAEFEKMLTFRDQLSAADRRKVKLIRLPENLGYFRALNIGLEQLESQPEKAVVGNNDLIFDRSFLAELSKAKFDDDVFVVCPDIVTADGFHQNPHVIKPLSPKRKLGFDLYFCNYYLGSTLLYFKRKLFPRKSNFAEGEFDVHMGIGACYILTSAFFERLKKLDDSVFLYGEEAFLSNQVKANGGRLLYYSKLQVGHLESVATSKIPAKKKYLLTQQSYRLYRDYL